MITTAVTIKLVPLVLAGWLALSGFTPSIIQDWWQETKGGTFINRNVDQSRIEIITNKEHQHVMIIVKRDGFPPLTWSNDQEIDFNLWVSKNLTEREAGIVKPTYEKELFELKEPLSSEIIEAFNDWITRQVYIDNNGNYRYRREGQPKTITKWNKAVKEKFKDVSEFHTVANKWRELYRGGKLN